MATINESGYKTFTATAVALSQNVRVLLDSSGTVSVAGATDDWIGTVTTDVAASGRATVRLRNAPGTFFMVASAAIAVGDAISATAGGKIDDGTATGGAMTFEALTAATADDDVIEVVAN